MKSTMKVAGMFILFALLAYVIVSYSLNTTNSSHNKPYDGKELRIGMVGEAPVVREKQVTFHKINLQQMKEENNHLDAIFISKEFLSKAAAPEFAKVYKELEIPVFFLQSERSYVPFFYEELSYEDAPDTSVDLSYATALVPQQGNEMGYWQFGVYNDRRSKRNIQSAYSKMFEAIDQGSINEEEK
ncbi:hypothetical protein PV403_02040 [Paenibacillus sp. GYB006]|uniref:hypothetical protein n=1 Tax=Paenibacillus sp. GYB006 TaxID=2994394 RepID=UPI002F96BA25